MGYDLAFRSDASLDTGYETSMGVGVNEGQVSVTCLIPCLTSSAAVDGLVPTSSGLVSVSFRQESYPLPFVQASAQAYSTSILLSPPPVVASVSLGYSSRAGPAFSEHGMFFSLVVVADMVDSGTEGFSLGPIFIEVGSNSFGASSSGAASFG